MVRKVISPGNILVDTPMELAREISIFAKDSIVILHTWLDEIMNINLKKSKEILKGRSKVSPAAISRVTQRDSRGGFIGEIIEAAPATFFDVGVKPHFVSAKAPSVTGGTVGDWMKEHGLEGAGIFVGGERQGRVSKLRKPGLQTLNKGFEQAMKKEKVIFERQRKRLRARSQLIFLPKSLGG